MTNTLNKIMHNSDEYLLPEGFSPDNAGTTNDVLTKTANGYEWSAPSGGDVVGPASATDGHLALFDGATGKLIKDGGSVPTGVPSGGTDGQVLSKVSGNIAWATPSGGDVQVSSQANNILTSGMKIWAGTETNYGNLGTYDQNTLYLTIDS